MSERRDDGLGRQVVEWPTLLLIAAVHLGIALLIASHAALPWWVLAPVGTLLLVIYGSLVHEVVHGHPTGIGWLNHAAVWPCLWLWYPQRLYRDLHLAHHHDPHLTDPSLDPESFYLTPAAWQRLPAPARALMIAHNTLAGRVLLGPPLSLLRLVAAHLPPLVGMEATAWRLWSGHLLACSPVVGWLLYCHMPVWQYLLACVWPAIALTQVRTFAEHRAALAVGERSAVVETCWPMALLFLNNNLHAVHHAMPGLAWYRLPGLWRAHRACFVRGNGGYVLSGYGALARRYLFRPVGPVAHPLMTPAPAPLGGPPDALTQTV